MTEQFILDCSVAAKWYLFDEQETDAARTFLLKLVEGRVELHAPDALKYELGHVLSKAQRAHKPRFSRIESERAYHHFCNLHIHYHELEISALQEAFYFGNRFHRNFYDACYLWLAEKLDCRWLTAERKFLGPHPLGFPEHRILLLDFPPQ